MSLVRAFNHLQPAKVLVIGDLVLDYYTTGAVKRISPEAPVPVLLVSQKESIIGAAGNVATNLLALGCEVTLVGRVGNDAVGEEFLDLMGEMGLSTAGIFVQKGTKTALKNRFIAQGQQLLRVDDEKVYPLPSDLEEKAKEYILQNLKKIDVIAISDYGKGFLSTSLIQFVIQESKQLGIRVIVDPKGCNFAKYSGAYIIKPNQKEAFAAAGMEEGTDLGKAAEQLLNSGGFEHLLVTRSEEGMTLFSKEIGERHFPVTKKNIVDVTGAGDTALAMVAFGEANNLSLEHTIELANLSSGIAVERLGCASIKLSEILKVILEKDPAGKIYEEVGESFVFRQSMENHPIIILNLEEAEEISMSLFQQIREASKRKGAMKLVVLIRPNEANKDFVHLLASMHEVDFVLSTRIGLESLIERLEPEEVWSGL